MLTPGCYFFKQSDGKTVLHSSTVSLSLDYRKSQTLPARHRASSSGRRPAAMGPGPLWAQGRAEVPVGERCAKPGDAGARGEGSSCMSKAPRVLEGGGLTP